MSIVVAVGMLPATAFAADGLSTSATAAEERAVRAQRIDALSGTYESDGIIVVYREGSAPSRKAEHGMTAQSITIKGLESTTAEVLSVDSGTPGGGAAFSVDLPDGVSVGEAVAAAQADPNVVLAQPNYLYYLLDEGHGEDPSSAPEKGQADATPVAASGTQAQPVSQPVAQSAQAAQPATEPAQAATEPAQTAQPSALAPETYTGQYPLPDDPLVQEDYNDTSQYPSTPNQWWIHAVDAPRAWSLVHGDNNQVAVAVLDTGISFDHEDLQANILADYAYDAYLNQKLTESIDDEEMQHGTHVAGIIAAEADNGVGIAGVSYNAKVLPIRVFHMAYSPAYGYDRAACSDEDLIRAYDYLLSDADGNGRTVAQETGTRVVNMSLGGYLQDAIDAGEDPDEAYDHLFEDKIEQAEAAGILTVAAAGNGNEAGVGRTDASYPSDYAAVMSVVALRTATTRTEWSDHNSMKNISAPGNNIYSTYWTGNPRYKFESGTSMATPLVAGCAALLWAYDPTLTVRDVKDILYSTADDLGTPGFDEFYGWGRVNIGAAVASLGTATVSLSNPTMVRTTSQQLTASEIADRTAQHTWKWSVDDASVLRVDQTGVVTALAPGRAVVTVQAQDNASITGHRTIEVEDIAIPAEVSASANPQKNTIALSWPAAEAATQYRILRATAAAGSTSEPGAFQLLGRFEAADLSASGSNLAYTDETAVAGVLYWYQVVPLGELDGLLVDGIPCVSNRCFYADKTQLKANIDTAEGLLDSIETSEDGSDVPVTAQWSTPDARNQLNRALSGAYSAYMSGSMLQSRVDYYAESLAAAIADFQAALRAGLKKIPATLEISAKTDPLAATFGVGASFAPTDLYQISGQPTEDIVYTLAAPEAGFSVASDGTLTVDAHAAVGSHELTVKAASAETETYEAATRTVSLTVQMAKAANGIAAQGKRVQIAYSASAQSVPAGRAVAASGGQGAVSFSKASGDARVSVAADGSLSVAAGTPAGTYRVGVRAAAAGDASHAAGSAAAEATVVVAKAANPLSAKAKAVRAKAAKKTALKASKAFSVKGAAGKVTYKKKLGSKKISVSASGKVTVKKGLKKGKTYKVKVAVTAAGDVNHASATKVVTLKVKVR